MPRHLAKSKPPTLPNFVKKICLILIIFNLFLASWYFINGDLFFDTDIARDFLLFEEIDQKKIVLIGARTGAAGVYHGPLWYYFNYPVFWATNGNPVAQGWFWMTLVVALLFAAFKIAKELFDEKVAYLFTFLLSTFYIFETKGFTHPHGAMFISLFFFYSIWQYIKTQKVVYLAANVLLAGLLIQLEIASGLPLLLLSAIVAIYTQYKKRKLHHMFAYLLLVIPLSTYIVFELRHDFFQLKNLIIYSQAESGLSFPTILKDRLDYITVTAAPIIQNQSLNRIATLLFLTTLFATVIKLKTNKIYLLYLFFFFGYFAFSLSSSFTLLRHHFLSFVPVTLLIFTSLLTNKYGKFLVPVFIFAIIANEVIGIYYLQNSKSEIGNTRASWKLMESIAADVFKGPENEFGYFVNTPDKLGYSPKYAMVYQIKNNPAKKAHYFEKKPITYVLVAPPPTTDPYVNADWWTKNAINIKKEPQKITAYATGFKIYRFELTDEEIAVPFGKQEDSGIHFR